MPTLSTLLVQREVASMHTIQEAIARQVLHGGDLITNILEVGGVSEQALVDVVAETFGIEPAPSGRLPAPAPAVLRLIPADLAYRHGIFPIALEGSSLAVATSEPLLPAVEEDLGFALNVGLRQLAAPLVRIRQAIAGYYGIPLDRRMLRLIARLEGRVDPSPSISPPRHGSDPEGRGPSTLMMPRPASVLPTRFGTGLPFDSGRRSSEAPASDEPLHDGFVDLPPAPAIPREMDLPPIGPVALPPVRAIPRPATGSLSATRGLASWLRRTVLEEKGRAAESPERTVPRARRKGPFTAAMAEQELEDALSTDTVLDTYFAFTRQFFVFSFLFVVHGDMAEGRNAFGPGSARLDITGVGVPLNLPSTLALARKRRAPVIAAFSRDGFDAEFIRDLGRSPEPGTSSLAAAVIPIVVRNRVVAILYGDDGDVPVELSSIGDVIAMTALTAGALERIILRKKLNSYRMAETAAREAEPDPEIEVEIEPEPETEPVTEAAPEAPPWPPVPLIEEVEPLAIPSSRSGRFRSSLGRPPRLPSGLDVPGFHAQSPLPGEVQTTSGRYPEDASWPAPSPRATLPVGSMPGAVSFDDSDSYPALDSDASILDALASGTLSVSGPSGAEPGSTRERGAADPSSSRRSEVEVADSDWWTPARSSS